MTGASLRQGWTTGACAAAAAKAAMLALLGALGYDREAAERGAENDARNVIGIPLPDGSRAQLPLEWTRRAPDGLSADAAIIKDAGDDPDATHGSRVAVRVAWIDEGEASGSFFDGGGGRDHNDNDNSIVNVIRIKFAAGEGVGVVTLPGLALPPGEPAINPGPRRMIRLAIGEAMETARELNPDSNENAPRGRALLVSVSIPGGRALAEKTFNPRLGVVGGLSILGSTGRVRPFSLEAAREAMRAELDVALAAGVRAPVLVPGHVGERAARRHFRLGARQAVHAGNEWGYMLAEAAGRPIDGLLVLGHPGKLAKLWMGQWDTHSSRSEGAAGPVARLAAERLGLAPSPETPTVEGLFMGLAPGVREALGRELAGLVREAIRRRFAPSFDSSRGLAVVLVNLAGDILGAAGGLEAWQ